MRKRVCVIVTLVMFIMNHLLPVNAVYADESVKNEVQSSDVEAAQSVESGRVYVENGEDYYDENGVLNKELFKDNEDLFI